VSRTIVRNNGYVPRISDERRAERRAEILRCARDLFTVRGFHVTSMDDIIEAVGMSPGGVYRYFVSKDEIVASIAREVIGGLVATIDAASEESPRPGVADVVRRLIVKVNAMADNEGRLALVVWGEAQSSEAVAQFAAQEVCLVRDRIVEYLRLTRGAALGTNEEDVDMASVVVSLLTGFLVQRRIIGPLDVDRYASTAARLLVDPARTPLK
jgi:AcrR family transcriptional regulator